MLENPLKLSPKQAKAILDITFPDYAGRKISLRFAEKVTFWDLNWGGGTKNDYRAVQVTGKVFSLPNRTPWDNEFEGMSINLSDAFIIVEHSHFCGRDLGITIYAHPSLAPKWLPG